MANDLRGTAGRTGHERAGSGGQASREGAGCKVHDQGRPATGDNDIESTLPWPVEPVAGATREKQHLY